MGLSSLSLSLSQKSSKMDEYNLVILDNPNLAQHDHYSFYTCWKFNNIFQQVHNFKAGLVDADREEPLEVY